MVRGYDHEADLTALRHYIREYKPVLIGVDGGADALLEAGLQAARDRRRHGLRVRRALARGAEVVVHAYPDGRAPGLARVQDLGIDAVTFPTSGTSEDVAMLLADEKGAELIVAVGTHATLVEFLDKGRAGMASTFLTRLRVGGKLVDAKGVSRLYRSRISAAALLLLVLAAMVAIVAALAVSKPGAPTSPASTTAGITSSAGYRTSSRDLIPLPPGLHRRGLPGSRARHRRRHDGVERSDHHGPAQPGRHLKKRPQRTDRPVQDPPGPGR